MRITRHTFFDDGTGFSMELDDGCNSPSSPSNLVYARTPGELSQRKDPPVNQGVSFREKLVTDDYYNTE